MQTVVEHAQINRGISEEQQQNSNDLTIHHMKAWKQIQGKNSQLQSDNFVELPGQIVSECSSNDVIIQPLRSDDLQSSPEKEFTNDESSNSSTEFNLQSFRTSNFNQQNSLKLLTSDEDLSLSIAKDKNRNNKVKILGIGFQIEILQQRNKDPLLFMKCLFLGVLISYFIILVTYVVGLNFKLIPTLLCLVSIVSSFIVVVLICQTPIKNGLKLDLKLFLSLLVLAIAYTLNFIFCYLVQMPFNSVPFFLILCYMQLIVFSFNGALMLTPNRTPFDDPNYQLKFFAGRVMAGLFNGTGLIDALSDIVLGLQLIQQPSNKFFVIGIFLFVLCNADYFQVIRRVLTPEKISLWEQLLTVFIELIVLTSTMIVLFDISKISQGKNSEGFLFVTVISITTTIINFSHNLVLLFHRAFSK